MRTKEEDRQYMIGFRNGIYAAFEFFGEKRDERTKALVQQHALFLTGSLESELSDISKEIVGEK